MFQQYMDKQILCQFFSNPLVFSQISDFLTINDVLRLCGVSKEMRKIVQAACSRVLRQNNINHVLSNKSAINRMQFYFNRCLKIVKDDRDLKNVTTLTQPFKLQIINCFEVGCMYTCYLTKDSMARIFRTSSFLEQNIEKPANLSITRKNVRDLSCKSQRLILTQKNGQVSFISSNKFSKEIIVQEEYLKWTNQIPIHKVTSSFNYAIFFPQNKTKFTTYLTHVFETTLTKSMYRQEDQDQDKTHLIVRNILTNSEHIICIPCKQILQCTVGHKSVYFISDSYECFHFDFNPAEDQRYLKATLFPGLAGKTIVKISNGYNFFIALERNMESLENWNNQRVLRWLREIGMPDFIKIAKVEKLDGKMLTNIERKYMINVLGITKQNSQQKFLTSIQDQMKKKSNQDQLYGWGKNEFGQLGSSFANYIAKPQKIKFNYLPENEYIDSIFCGWFQTFVRTQKGRIFCTITKNQRMKKREREEKMEQEKGHSSDDDEKEEARHKHNKNKKKKKKTRNDRDKDEKKIKSHKKYEEEDNWYVSPLGKSFFVQAFKDNTFYIQCLNQQKEEPDKKKKLRTAKTILNKILWSSLNKDEFKVGYIDNEFGLIEASAYEMQMFDVKEGRIKYFKRNGAIIWDRENKIDYL